MTAFWLVRGAAVPPAAPLAMPAQDLGQAPAARHAPASLRARAARLGAFGGGAVVTLWAGDQMLRAFGPYGIGALQQALLALFVISVAWIAFAACSAVVGLLAAQGPRDIGAAGRLSTRTAIIMPVYNEDAAACFGALAAIAEGLADLGHGDAFELFVLSDTRDADALARETTAFGALRAALGGRVAAWYRWRPVNTGRKAGNVQDFVERWGGRYDFMLVLDADSLMAPEAVVALVRRMEARPGLALLQTSPQLIGGRTPFARLQQFASALYGPVVSRGVAAWQGLDGNFWGHNALIRVSAFAASAGLPSLPGKPPFGGDVLSHDFVEAALLRRAGWEVRMDPDLGGSWEGAPPDLAAAAARDRRWAQGNLQHARVIGAAGLRGISRAHMAIGIASYLMSPLWFAMLLVGLAVAAQASLQQHDHFPQLRQLFPHWPRFDAARMTMLFGATLALLLLPKALGLARALATTRTRRAFGGAGRLLAGAGCELVLSALLAPVQMLTQSRHVAEILAGLDSGWKPQARHGDGAPWSETLRSHGPAAALGAAGAIILGLFDPGLAPWMAPVLCGWIAAPALARWVSRAEAGQVLARAGLLVTPEDMRPPRVAMRAAALAQALRAASAGGFGDLMRNPRLAEIHHQILPPAALPDEDAFLAGVTGAAKLAVAPTVEAAVGWLTASEKLQLLTARPHDEAPAG